MLGCFSFRVVQYNILGEVSSLSLPSIVNNKTQNIVIMSRSWKSTWSRKLQDVDHVSGFSFSSTNPQDLPPNNDACVTFYHLRLFKWRPIFFRFAIFIRHDCGKSRKIFRLYPHSSFPFTVYSIFLFFFVMLWERKKVIEKD